MEADEGECKGSGSCEWDFQFLISDYEVGKRYQMVMRAAYIPYESPEQVEKATAADRAALGQPVASP